MSLPRHFSLYNGVSERTRGWKSKRSDKPTEDHTPSNLSIMRWDGATRSSSPWDCLRRDPELWYRDGDCFVHLYGQGQSRRGPAFKVPFSALLEANCYPLLERFMTREVSEVPAPLDSDQNHHARFARMSRQPRIELYIPAPPGSDKQQAFNYHLGTRNLFAFVFRRSLVGEHLGTALISLLRSMHELRIADADNLTDLLGYVDEEGYLDMKDRPVHALAMLHFAEAFQLRNVYIEAFAHCCGMSERLFLSPEYQLLSATTRKLLRRTSLSMEVKLGQMGTMLSTFLQDELSEAHLGLHAGGRAHLERFRTLLHGFYAAKLGYYPPPSVHPRTTIFEVDIFRTLRDDFEALYQYLVDETFEPSQGVLPSAQGGICALQSVQSFDKRYNFTTLKHPLPLLPNIRQQTSSKRMTWFGKQPKISASQRNETHIALLQATNESNIELLDNDLVRAYRKFEEDSIYSPIKGDKQEQLNLVDARKVRWILVYAVYQTLRHATEPPAEVRDVEGAPYNICISTTNLPPWKEEESVPSFVRVQTDQITRNPSVSTSGWSANTDTPATSDAHLSFDIKPDIDYLGLLHKESAPDSGLATPAPTIPEGPARRASLTRGLSRSRAFRRSLRLFSHQDSDRPVPSSPRKAQQYHEIVVLGYGNGTHDVEFTPHEDGNGMALMVSEIKNTATTSRSPSTASSLSHSTDISASEDGSALTVDTSLTESVTVSPVAQTIPESWELSRNKSFCVRERRRDTESATPRAMSMCSSSKPPAVLFISEKHHGHIPKLDDPQRSRSLLDRYRKSLEPAPLKIRKRHSTTFEQHNHSLSNISDASNDEIWEDIQTFTDMQSITLKSGSVNYDNYNDLGGLTEMNDVLPRRLSTIF
ncbi:hypothetical protein AB5N19_06364 [Seiridium cardinale]